ncbi:MAG TPA: AAA family ATPase, partial [Kofleriaceae bacterium]|nr:AAA family ATPase [Kofleriaceae bacterium]
MIERPEAQPPPVPEFAGTERFEVVRRLGTGGMGVVYEAVDRERNARVALKTLRTMAPDELLALKHEFRALQDVTHPNLVTLGELIEDQDRWFFTMELVDGEDVLCFVRGPELRAVGEAATVPHVRPRTDGPTPSTPRGSSFDEARLRSAFLQLAHALDALHAARKVHRDIKPSNVLVSREGRVVVLDFGLAHDTQRAGWQPRLAGTLGYMAPELFTTGSIGQAGDWYAAGVLLFEALTGRQPFVAPSRLALLDTQQRDGPAPSDLGFEVPRDLDALCQELLRCDPVRRPDGHEVLRRLGQTGLRRPSSPSRPPFVGRRDELARLAAAMAEVEAGHGRTVLVRGESGVGKSYLVRQFTSQVLARQPDAVVLVGRCYERESVPYKALDGIVDELTRFLGATPGDLLDALLPPGAGALARLFPVLRGVLPALAAGATAASEAAPADDRSPQEVRAEAFAALREIVRRVALAHPLVLVVDDLHWTDADSVHLLRELLRAPAPPFLLIATLRESDVGQVKMDDLLEAIPASEPGHDLRLAALSADDAEQLVVRLAEHVDGAGPLDPRTIAREAGGHPMFIHELVRHLAAGGDEPALPRIDDAIRARILRLDEPTRTIVELVALAGSPLAQETIARASGLDLD